MKIKHIKVWKEDLKLKRPYTIASKTINTVESVFVVLENEQGIYGIGAANPSKYVVGKDVEDTFQNLQTLKDRIIGMEVVAMPAMLQKMHQLANYSIGALTTLDIAVHDLWCKSMGISIAAYYGQVYQTMPTSITIGIKSVAATLEEAAEYVGRGFDHLKVKLGKDLEEDIERLAKLREQYGNSIQIRVDANQGYTIGELQRLYDVTKIFNLELIEQPVPEADTLTLKSLSPAIKQLIAADEYLKYPVHALDLIDGEGACGIFNIKLMKCGGIQAAKTIATIGQLRHIDLMWGCNDESIVSISAALHTAFSCPNTKYLDLDGSLDLAKDIVKGGFKIENGQMFLLEDSIGLGVELL